MSEKITKQESIGQLGLEVSEDNTEAARRALDTAASLLLRKLPGRLVNQIRGTKVFIDNGLTEGGGVANAEEKTILLDSEKNKLSLQKAEDYLVQEGYLNQGDWTKAIPQQKDEEWSCLTYQTIHEVGHLVDFLAEGESYKRLEGHHSPTKYGESGPVEAFAEAFTYWILDQDIDPEADSIINGLMDSYR
jgi:hypothetical protein